MSVNQKLANIGQSVGNVPALKKVLMKNLEEGGGGGSTVEVTQIVSSGTKIATITVDDVGTDLYAPNGGSSSVDYSTDEVKIGTWVDGSDLYQKTLVVTSGLTDAGSIDVSSLGANMLYVYDGYWDVTDGDRMLTPLSYASGNRNYIAYNATDDTLDYDLKSNWTINGLVCTVRYTKASS